MSTTALRALSPAQSAHAGYRTLWRWHFHADLFNTLPTSIVKRLFPIQSFAGRMACGIALAVATANACAADAPLSIATQIAQLLSHTYDGPDRRVATEAVALAGKFAIADWTQREMAGRALLRVVNHHWTIVTCGGAALKDPAWLKDAGVPSSDVHVLLSRLADAERPMRSAAVARFDRFRMPSDMSSAPGAAPH